MIITVAAFEKLLVFRGTHGIYAIRNLQNTKRYVGSAVDLYDRLYQHVWHLDRGTHRNPKLQRAWMKYGAKCFCFEVLELVGDPAQLVAREQQWINAYDAVANGYNVRAQAGSNLGHKFSAEVRAKVAAGARQVMSDPATKERHRELTRAAMADPAVRQKCRDAIHRRYSDPTQKAALVASQTTPEVIGRRSEKAHRYSETRSAEERHAQSVSAAAKLYDVTYPDGRVERIKNLKLFCLEHDLPYDSALGILRGTMKAVRGFRIAKVDE